MIRVYARSEDFTCSSMERHDDDDDDDDDDDATVPQADIAMHPLDGTLQNPSISPTQPYRPTPTGSSQATTLVIGLAETQSFTQPNATRSQSSGQPPSQHPAPWLAPPSNPFYSTNLHSATDTSQTCFDLSV